MQIANQSSEYAQLAFKVQLAEEVLQTINERRFILIEIRFTFNDDVDVAGCTSSVSRTGYTGEDGFEIYCDFKMALHFGQAILDAGKEEGVVALGLGARDTLRFEANLPLYGQELSTDITPIEAGIGFAVKMNKEADFIGKAVLKEQKEKAGSP